MIVESPKNSKPIQVVSSLKLTLEFDKKEEGMEKEQTDGGVCCIASTFYSSSPSFSEGNGIEEEMAITPSKDEEVIKEAMKGSEENGIKDEVVIINLSEQGEGIKQAMKGCGGDNDNDNDDDGYHTPTSPCHRIPLPTECPPAPRKPPCQRTKRRRSSTALRLFNDEEINSIFSEISDRIVSWISKKARSGEPAIDY